MRSSAAIRLIEPGTNDRAQVAVTAVRFRRAEDDSAEFLIVKEDDSTAWAGRDELDFPSGAAPSTHQEEVTITKKRLRGGK